MFAVRSRYIENPQAWQATPGTTFFQKRLDQGQYYASKDFKDGTGLSSACTIITLWASKCVTKSADLLQHARLTKLCENRLRKQGGE